MKISVAMCTYNGEKYIKEQLDSIFNQTLKVDEIIICDDLSNDKTINIIEDFNQNYPDIISLFVNEINLKSVKNFEKAISLCTGEIVFLSDQDDKWVESKVENYLEFFKNNPNIDVIASNGFCINKDSKIIDSYTIWDIPSFLKSNNKDCDYFKMITHIGNFVTGASMALRKSIQETIFPFPILKNFHHDEWIAILTAHENKFEFLDEKYFYYRIHDNQQVGGVCYDKKDHVKTQLIDMYDLVSCKTFVGYKRKLKKLEFNYRRNRKLQKYCLKNNHKDIFDGNTEKIKSEFEYFSKQFKRDYPIKSFFLNISDTITNKRKIKK